MGLNGYVFPGLPYDRWELDKEYVTGARTITEGDAVNFAGLSGDWGAAHTNDVYGKTTVFGDRIVYGNMTFIASTGLMSQTLMFEGTTVAMLDMRVSYQKPVRFGDTIYCKFTPIDKRECKRENHGLVTFKVFVLNQNGEQVAEEILVFMISNKIQQET